MDVAAIVVNYRTAEESVHAVNALLAELGGDARVVLLDNDSRDGSFERLIAGAREQGWGARVVLMQSGYNGGYGYGINVAIQEALSWPQRPRYLYVINPDAKPLPGSVQKLVQFMDAHPEAGVAGSTVHNDNGSFVSAFRFPSVLGEFEGNINLGVVSKLLQEHQVPLAPPGRDLTVDWVPGTSMLIRAEVLATAGGFDEDFFLYYEEIDFCRRVINAGWKVYFVEGAGVSHIGSLATGMADRTRRMPSYWFAARRRYFVKHHGRLYAAAADAAWFTGHLIRKAADRMLSREPSTRPHLARDFARYALRHVTAPAPRSAAPHPKPASVSAQVASL